MLTSAADGPIDWAVEFSMLDIQKTILVEIGKWVADGESHPDAGGRWKRRNCLAARIALVSCWRSRPWVIFKCFRMARESRSPRRLWPSAVGFGQTRPMSRPLHSSINHRPHDAAVALCRSIDSQAIDTIVVLPADRSGNPVCPRGPPGWGHFPGRNHHRTREEMGTPRRPLLPG